MTTREELAAMYNIETKPDYESEAKSPRIIQTIEHLDSGALSVTWTDDDGVLYRHTTSKYNPPELAPTMVVVGGWIEGGYHLLDVTAKQWLC